MNIHCLGITEANLRAGADLKEVNVPGYNLVWDGGRENNEKANSRVVGERSYTGTIVKIGPQRHKKDTHRVYIQGAFTLGVQQGSVKEQEGRWARWLEARKDTWKGTEEVFVLGDLNLDWKRRDDPGNRNRKMLQELCKAGYN